MEGVPRPARAELVVSHAWAIARGLPAHFGVDLHPPATPHAAIWNVGAVGAVRLWLAAHDALAVVAVPPVPLL